MRVLLTSILCRSGLMTHVNDLARYLAGRGIFAAIAFKRVNYLSDEGKQSILARLGEIPRLIYDSTEELERFIAEIKCTLIHAHSTRLFSRRQKPVSGWGFPWWLRCIQSIPGTGGLGQFWLLLTGLLPWVRLKPGGQGISRED
jgi:hypothetical protein